MCLLKGKTDCPQQYRKCHDRRTRWKLQRWYEDDPMNRSCEIPSQNPSAWRISLHITLHHLHITIHRYWNCVIGMSRQSRTPLHHGTLCRFSICLLFDGLNMSQPSTFGSEPIYAPRSCIFGTPCSCSTKSKRSSLWHMIIAEFVFTVKNIKNI